jgi:energy-converting hydrogenase Eha subunit E
MVVFNLHNIINIVSFAGLSIAAYTSFYFSTRMAPEKKVTASIFTLSLGINLIGLSNLFRLWEELLQPFLITTTIAIGSILTFIGIISVFREKTIEMETLRKRRNEIQSMITSLKDKYYQLEISEDELRSVHTSLLKELAEIDVRLKKGQKISEVNVESEVQ